MSGHESDTPLLIDRLFEEFFERGLKYFFPFATFEPIGSSPDSHIGVVEGYGNVCVEPELAWVSVRLQKQNAVHGA